LKDDDFPHAPNHGLPVGSAFARNAQELRIFVQNLRRRWGDVPEAHRFEWFQLAE
jgi:hypothetical protein